MTIELSTTEVWISKSVLKWIEECGWSPGKINRFILHIRSEQVWEKPLANAVKDCQFKSFRTLKNTFVRKKKISRPHEKSSWCEGFWLHSLTAAVNNRDQYKKISADAHMQLDAEQHQEKKGNFK